MPVNLHVIKTSDFVCLDGQGRFDVWQSKAMLEQIARTCVERGINCALLDVRDMRTDMTSQDLQLLASAFPSMGFEKDHRLAVLHRFFSNRADVFAMFANEQGWNVKAFDTYEDAIAWFSESLPAV